MPTDRQQSDSTETEIDFVLDLWLGISEFLFQFLTALRVHSEGDL